MQFFRSIGRFFTTHPLLLCNIPRCLCDEPNTENPTDRGSFDDSEIMSSSSKGPRSDFSFGPSRKLATYGETPGDSIVEASTPELSKKKTKKQLSFEEVETMKLLEMYQREDSLAR